MQEEEEGDMSLIRADTAVQDALGRGDFAGARRELEKFRREVQGWARAGRRGLSLGVWKNFFEEQKAGIEKAERAARLERARARPEAPRRRWSALFNWNMALTALFLVLLAGLFYVTTTEVFVVELGGGIWWFALVLMLALVGANAYFFLRSTFGAVQRACALLALAALTAAAIALGIKYRPFEYVQLTQKFGALFGKEVDPPLWKGEDLPEPRDAVSMGIAPPLNQGRCGSCVSYAIAAMLAARGMQAGRAPRRSCITTEGDVQDWLASPQALLDLTSPSGATKCDGQKPGTSLGLLAKYDLPDAHCVPGYSARAPDCAAGCGSPEGQWCLLPGQGPAQHAACADGSAPARRRFGGTPRLVRGATDAAKFLSSVGPLVCRLSSYSGALWHLNQAGFNSVASAGFIARPRDDPKYGTGEEAGHLVMVYGYGTSTAGVPYWKVQNSWGRSWGAGGTVKIERGVNAWNIESYCYGLL